MNPKSSNHDIPTLLTGKPIPSIIYGTARRNQEQRAKLFHALLSGYRAVDTANSRLFHDENEDGRAIAACFEEGFITREEILIQSKYSGPAGQADPWPYAVEDGTTARVLKSVLRSAADLGVEVIDLYFLHTPLNSLERTLEAWKVLENIVDHGGIRYLGIANVKLGALRHLFEHARVKPQFVQNWFRKSDGYNREVMMFCKDHNITYQIFGVFDEENAELLRCDPVQGRTGNSFNAHQALLQMLLSVAASQGLRLCILDGTTNLEHASGNLQAVAQVPPAGSDVEALQSLIGWE